MGAATWTAPRFCGLLEMRIFIPLSDEISIESTVDSSMMSMSFLTYRRSIIESLAIGMRDQRSSMSSREHCVSTTGPSGPR